MPKANFSQRVEAETKRCAALCDLQAKAFDSINTNAAQTAEMCALLILSTGGISDPRLENPNDPSA